LPVRILSDKPREYKDALIDWVFAHPHRFVTEDLEWAHKTFGMDERQCKDQFRLAPKLGCIFVHDIPLYLFAVPPSGIVNTASEARLERYGLALTKDAIRFGRSPEGKQMLTGSTGYIEQSDIENGSVRSRWLQAIGYRLTETVEAYGQSFLKFDFQG
jgi:hypothetical protein